MNEITDYAVVRGSIFGEMSDNLASMVKEWMADGWQPLGQAMPTNSEYAIQTMVKYKKR